MSELEPPGELYAEWYRTMPGMGPAPAWADPRLDDESRDVMVRLARLGPLYAHEVPAAALHLDMAIDMGKLGLILEEGAGTLVSVEDLAGRFGAPSDENHVRESLHRLHALGMLLVEMHHDTPLLRIVARRPDTPGGKWIFQDAPEAATVPKACIPNQAQDELSAEEFGALVYMRGCLAASEEPDPRDFARFDGVNGPEHVEELFAAVRASGWLDKKGCDACPVGDLCSRTKDDAPRTQARA